MPIRDNVRRRRRERIMQLLGQQPAAMQGVEIQAKPRPYSTDLTNLPLSTDRISVLSSKDEEPDPEKWWKERQRTAFQAGQAWGGASRLAPTSVPPRAERKSYFIPIARGMAIRVAVSVILFSAAWVWFRSELPGSEEARSWTAAAVSRDMDFQAVEAWYAQTFGGSPSFLPMFLGRGETQAVFSGWKRSEAVLPVKGRLVQTFAQDGSGVRIAAPGGSEVKAVYAGRVLHVASEEDGKATVLVQHAGKIVSVYGNLSLPAVQPNDWVEAGQRLGAVPAPLDADGESLLYFAVKQNDKTIDPAEVVPFD